MAQVEYVDACLICGIFKGLERFEKCNEEMDHAGIERVNIPNHDPKHIWGESKIVHGWYGKSIIQELKEFEEQ